LHPLIIKRCTKKIIGLKALVVIVLHYLIKKNSFPFFGIYSIFQTYF